MSLQNQAYLDHEPQNLKSQSSNIVNKNENLQNRLNLIDQGVKNHAKTSNPKKLNESSEFSHIIEDNVIILNMIKQKQLHNKNNTKINKESQNQYQMRNNKNVSILTADFGGSNYQSEDNNQSMRPINQDQEKSLTQEDQNNLNQYLTIKNNFRTSQGQNNNKNDPQNNRGKVSSNLDFKSINDDSFSSFDRKISATNGENTNNTNQTSTLRENLTNSKRIQYSNDDLKNNEHKISINNECMSHNSESRFQNQSSKGQDTQKSTEDKDKKYSVSFSDNIGQGYMNTNENDNNTLSRRSEFDNNTLSKRSGNGLLSNETYKSNNYTKDDSNQKYFISWKSDYNNKSNGNGNTNGLQSNGSQNGFYNNTSENVSSGKKVSINANGTSNNNSNIYNNNQYTPEFNLSNKKISVNGGHYNNQAQENNKKKNSKNEIKQNNSEYNDKLSTFGNQDVNNRYDMIIDEDNKADGSTPADFFHTEYMKYRNLIHWSKVQNIKLVKDINSSNK